MLFFNFENGIIKKNLILKIIKENISRDFIFLGRKDILWVFYLIFYGCFLSKIFCLVFLREDT